LALRSVLAGSLNAALGTPLASIPAGGDDRAGLVQEVAARGGGGVSNLADCVLSASR